MGLAGLGTRRVSGLRREEVAALAGLSADYYRRLEQGRETHPSASVLSALARALQLEPDARRYLFAIATPRPIVEAPRAAEAVDPGLLELLGEWQQHPAVLLDRCHTIVGANALGAALYSGHRYSGNLTRLAFLDPDARSFYRDWETVAATTVAAMRAAAVLDPDDRGLAELVCELEERSDEFRVRWSRAEVREKTSGALRIAHPEVGDLDLTYHSLRPGGAAGLLLKVYRAVPGTATADRLAMLGSLAAGHAGGRLATQTASVLADDAPLDRA